MRALRIGSRGSQLALWQARFVQSELQRLSGVSAELVIIKTAGDQAQQASVSRLGLKGVFIKELEDALLDERVDLAVHSMKDVPTEHPAGLHIAAVTKRADPRDCLVSKNGAPFSALPQSARIGTSSLRRQAQLRHLRPDIHVSELRGNVDTRLRKVRNGACDAVVLAKAGLDRLGLSDQISETFAEEMMLPAVGQGALGIECRDGDHEVGQLLLSLNHNETRAAVTAERALLARLEGGCQVPLGAWGRCVDGEILLDACVLSPDGARCIHVNARGTMDAPQSLGQTLAEILFAQGAAELLKLARQEANG